MALINIDEFRRITDSLWANIRNNFPKLNAPNTFTDENTFEEAYISSKVPYLSTDTPYTNIAGGFKKTGRKDFSSHANGNSGYVKCIHIRVSNGKGAGHTTTASLWEVRKSDDSVIAKIVDNQEFEVLDGTVGNSHTSSPSYGKFIEIPIQKQYDEDTYFIFQITPTSDMAYTVVTPSENTIYIDGEGDLTTEAINNSINATTVGMYWVTGDNVSIRGKFDELKNHIDEANGRFNEYAHLEEENIISGKTTLVQPYIKGIPVKKIDNPRADLVMPSDNFSASTEIFAPANKRVSTLVVGMDSSITTRSTVADIKVGVADMSNNYRLEEYVLDGHNGTVIENPIVNTDNGTREFPIDAEKVMVLHINRTWNYDAMFVLSITGMLWGGRRDGGIPGLAGGGRPMPSIGSNVTMTNGNNYIGKVLVYGDEIRLQDAISWGSLEHVNEYSNPNLIDATAFDTSRAISDTGEIVPNSDANRGIVEFNIRENTEYTLLRQSSGAYKIRLENADGTTHECFTGAQMPSAVNGWHRLVFTANTGMVKGYYEANVSHNSTSRDMIVEGNHPDADFIDTPYTDGHNISISTNVSLGFDKTGSDIKASTVEGAIKELDRTVPKLNNTGKIDASYIPSMNEYLITEIISLYQKPNNADTFTKGNFTFMYAGVGGKQLNTADYQELANALGQGSGTVFELPYIADIQGAGHAITTRYHYICVKTTL